MRFTAFASSSVTLLALSAAFRLPDFEPFISALNFSLSISDYIPSTDNATLDQPHELLKRQFSNTCPDKFDSCTSLGAPGLCCAEAAVCSPDAAGNVACCPIGAVCSGTINEVVTAGELDELGRRISATVSSAVDGALQTVTSVVSSFVEGASSTVAEVVAAATPLTTAVTEATTEGGFIIDEGSTVATFAGTVRNAQIVSLHLYPTSARAPLPAFADRVQPAVMRAVIWVLEYFY